LVDTVMIGAVPVPVSETVCGLFEALSAIVSAPVRGPAAVGVKVTLTVQLELAATLVPQLLACAKSPLACTALMEIEVVPEFDKVTGCEMLVVPTCCELNVRLAGEEFKIAVAVVPVPLRRRPRAKPPPFSGIVKEANREPVAEGVNVTVTVQNPPGLILAAQLLVWLKSAAFEPLMLRLPMVNGTVPTSVMVKL
jgi:hypothetical protein